MAGITSYDPSGPSSEIVATFTMRKEDLYSLDMWLIPAIATAIEAWLPYSSGYPASEASEADYRAKLDDMLAKLHMATDNNNYCISADVLSQVNDGLAMLVDILPGLWL